MEFEKTLGTLANMEVLVIVCGIVALIIAAILWASSQFEEGLVASIPWALGMAGWLFIDLLVWFAAPIAIFVLMIGLGYDLMVGIGTLIATALSWVIVRALTGAINWSIISRIGYGLYAILVAAVFLPRPQKPRGKPIQTARK